MIKSGLPKAKPIKLSRQEKMMAKLLGRINAGNGKPKSEYEQGYYDAEQKYKKKAELVDKLAEVLSDYFMPKSLK